MGIIDDVTKLLRKGPELMAQANSMKMNTKSIIRGANDATFQFPVLIPETVPIETANTLARTLDRVYASFTQSWISLHPFMDITLDPTPLSYLKRLHQNMRFESVREFKDNGEALEKAMQEAYDGRAELYMTPDESFGILFEGVDQLPASVIKSHKDYMREYLSEFDLRPFAEAQTDGTSANDLANAVLDSKINNAKAASQRDMMRMTDGKSAELIAKDFKQTNDFLPYGIEVRLIAKNEKNEFVQYVDFVIGVKAYVHPVKSNEIIENIQRAYQNKSLLFKFLRWTTGEISLVKNILLNIDDIKLDAANRAAGKNMWFSSLKRLKDKKLTMRNLTVPTALLPNATIVMSAFEADYLKDKCAINVRDPKVGKKLINSLFLVTLIIIDEGSGSIDILYDGSSNYQTYALETLEREVNLSSNKLGREIGRMISH